MSGASPAGGGPVATPDIVPARMVNEFIYCARLFYLEWVQGRFASSDDVEEGLYVHRVVDEPSTAPIPAPNALEQFAGRRWRALWLSSPELGVAAKIDVVEVGGSGQLIPVDYKKGRPARSGEMWPSDAAQSALQALLLREAGYTVDTAEVWYAETRQRAVLTVDDQLIDQTRSILHQLLAIAGQDSPPPPLEDSPKCPRCSLVGICLPDEINALRARTADGSRPRRLVPSDPDSRPLYVTEQGAQIGVRRERVEAFKDGSVIASIRLIDVSQLCIYGNVSVTPHAMREMFARSVPVCWFSYGGWFSGIANGLPGKYVDLRAAQYTAVPAKTTAIARRIVAGKIRNARTLLRRNARSDPAVAVHQLGQLAADAEQAPGVPSLLGTEGSAARIYFGLFTDMLSPDSDVNVSSFNGNGRRRRPPPDPVNALLSFAYALLVKDITATLVGVGLDPYLGVYHRPRFGRPALSLDLAEEFRPLIADSVVLQVVNNGEVHAADFLSRAGSCQLQAAGRKAIIRAYERRLGHEVRHPVFGYRTSYRRALEVQARLLGAHLTGEIPAYVPFTTR